MKAMKILLALFVMFVFVNSMVQDVTEKDNQVESSFIETSDNIRHSLVSSQDAEDEDDDESDEADSDDEGILKIKF